MRKGVAGVRIWRFRSRFWFIGVHLTEGEQQRRSLWRVWLSGLRVFASWRNQAGFTVYLPRQMEDGGIIDGLSGFDRFLLLVTDGWIGKSRHICGLRRF